MKNLDCLAWLEAKIKWNISAVFKHEQIE